MTARISSRYRVIRQLGSGGMGEVLLAEDTHLSRQVAVKVMSSELAENANERKRFRTEARVASGLSHPNVCVIHEVGETGDGRPFLAMEYVEGQTLDLIQQQRRVRLREVVQIGIEVAEALQAAHDVHLAHRDIKPSNIMLDARGRVKVLDFGLAKRLAQEELGAMATTSAAHTRTGFLVGTPHYMSPEQVLGREVDHRTDIFSLGVVLYELAVGQRPFLGRTVGEVINNVVNQKPEPLGLENPRFSPALDNIIFKCLEKEPENRYGSARELAHDLTALKNQADRESALDIQATVPGTLPVPPKDSNSPIRVQRNALYAAAVVALLLLAGVAVLLSYQSKNAGRNEKAEGGPPSDKSVAVLPFDNFSPERDTDYLSDGLTEEITTALSRVPGLKVVSRNSSFTFKGRREDLRKIGRALGVGTVLEGSIRKAGDQIRVSAQLINARDGYHLWSETYDREVKDIFAVQEEIARQIAERLQGQSTPTTKRQAVAPEAYKLYLQGKMFWNKRTAAGLHKSIELYQQALEKEPTYAAAHAALASSYLLLPQYGEGVHFSQYSPLVRASASRALELDPNCVEAHAALGMLQERLADCAGGLDHLHHATELAPSDATAHHWYGLCLECCGHRDEGLAELQKAVELDPQSAIIHSTIPEWHYFGKDYDRAIAEAHSAMETFPDFAPLRGTLIAALMMKNQYREALAETEKARALVPDQPLMFISMKGFCLARLGQEAEARKIIDDLEVQRKQGKATEGMMAHIFQGLRQYDKALELAEQARINEGFSPEMLFEPGLDELRSMPEFQALLQRAGLTNAVVP